MPSPVVGEDIYGVGQFIAGLGGGARPKMEGTQKAKKLSQSPVKGWVKVTQKQKWFDLTAAGAPPEKIEATQHCLVSLWKALKREQFRSASPVPAIPDALPAPAEASGIHALDT